MPNICRNCGDSIPFRVEIEGKIKNLHSRRYCLKCSPFGKNNRFQIHKAEENKKRDTIPHKCVDCGKEFISRRLRCPTCFFKLNIKRRLKEVHDIVGTSCWICGYDKGIQAKGVLEFHHMSPSEKDFNVSSREMAMFSMDRIWTEIKKCSLLCCRCHREFHIGLLEEQKVQEAYEQNWNRIQQVSSVGRTSDS